MNTKDQKKSDKKQYTKPQIKKLGRLSTLIQGITGLSKDKFPMEGPSLT